MLALYNRAILYLKAFVFALKAFATWSSAVGKIKVEVFVAFYANKPAPVGNTMDLERFKCRHQAFHTHVRICLCLRDRIITSLLENVKECRVGPLSKYRLE